MHTTATELLVTVTDETFAASVLASDLPVVVDFWAEWCPPCRKISHTLAELAVEFEGRMVFAALNSDENPRTTRDHRVMSLPTLLVFRGGVVVGSIVGARPKGYLRDALGAHAA
ncbi:thioredoxin domain-containing protein [Longispora sp. NPDC051575]|uniref:thioredoxin family protein n=1 Tax=Longispora sp. NPDC051575 TaxID=3154943 RepID=UPI00342B31AB